MDFAHIGATCAFTTCKQHDFLPFECEVCHRQFCNDHRKCEDHNCSGTAIKDHTIPKCPICDQIILVKRDEDPNVKMNDHINAGCRREEASRKTAQKCSFPTCKQAELIPVHCKVCTKNFCMRHRNELDHKCEGPPTRRGFGGAASKKTAALAPKPKPAPAKPKPVPASTSAAATKKLPSSTKGMKLAQGDEKVPLESRFVMGVNFPAVSGITPRYIFYSQRWTVGKVIDAICEAGRVKNTNNVAGSDKLHLFAKKTKECLPNGTSLADLQAQGKLRSGDEVVLEFGEVLTTGAASQGKKDNCTVM